MSKSKKVAIGLALVLSGMVAGVAGAQVFLLPNVFLNTGLFTVRTGEAARFHVSLDDSAAGPSATVMMRILDHTGALVARRDVTLLAGQSATLETRRVGLFRAHAEIIDPDTTTGGRRALLGTVEIFDLDDAYALKSYPPRFVCMADDSGGPGRIPD